MQFLHTRSDPLPVLPFRLGPHEAQQRHPHWRQWWRRFNNVNRVRHRVHTVDELSNSHCNVDVVCVVVLDSVRDAALFSDELLLLPRNTTNSSSMAAAFDSMTTACSFNLKFSNSISLAFCSISLISLTFCSISLACCCNANFSSSRAVTLSSKADTFSSVFTLESTSLSIESSSCAPASMRSCAASL